MEHFFCLFVQGFMFSNCKKITIFVFDVLLQI